MGVRKLAKSKWVWGVAGVVVVPAVVGMSLVGKDVETAAVSKTVSVKRSNVVSYISATGTINPLNSVNVSSKITEQIKDVLVEDNQRVVEGQILTVMDDTRINAQVRQAQADLLRAQANLAKLMNGSRLSEINSADSGVGRAKARLDNAAANLARYKQLTNIGAVSQQQLDTAETEYRVAQSEYQSAAEQLNLVKDGARSEEIDMARAQVEQSKAILDSYLAQLNDTVIKAPIAGTVIGKPIPKGQTVSPGISTPMVLMTIADTGTMQIDTQVDETDISKVAMGQKATFTVDAYPGQTFEGVVTSISSKANIQQNVVYYSVLINVDNSKGLLKPTMTARVKIHAGERQNALSVPAAAIKDRQGSKFVTVLSGNQQKQVKVETGLVGEDNVEIVSGLKEGDVIVLGATGSATKVNSTNPLKGLFGRGR